MKDDYSPIIEINSKFHAELFWGNAKGKRTKTVPKVLKDSRSEFVKEQKARVKQVNMVLATWRLKIERFPVHQREHTVAQFRERFLTHPIVGVLVRSLIWESGDSTSGRTVGLATADGLLDIHGQTQFLDEEWKIRLWHPHSATAAEVAAWRHKLQDSEITQPFKQAHREIYRLTDAEQESNTYSNRFAGHVLRQPVFKALCETRGWEYSTQGAWSDGFSTPTLQLPTSGLRAEFEVDPANANTSPTGACRYLETGPLRFYSTGSKKPERLESVPKFLFSEVMRDVDLFVAVAGISADQTWEPTRQNPYTTVWQSSSFGKLTELGQTRKDVLKLLVPRLKIANQCSFEGYFLRVQGELRAYRIHLGSGNILMEPNDEYLCISTSRSKRTDQITLPFAGDTTLSIILSKAFLLADDHRIKDPSILRQIKNN